MKLLRSFLLGAVLSTAPVGLMADVAGNYQALLYSESGDLGSPVALVTATVNTKGTLSGKLTSEDQKVYSFKTKAPLVFEEGDEATTEDIVIKRGKDQDPFTLRITFFDSVEGPYCFATLLEGEEKIADTENGLPVVQFTKGPAAFAGNYTMALELGTDPEEDEPAGSGYAIGKIDAKGLLKLVGKTGDGISFTASLPASVQQQFFMFVNPYKRAGSFLAGKLKLGIREDDLPHMLPAETGYDLQWKKAAGAKDKSYRNGFGPLDVIASIEPWAPAAKQPIADYFGMGLNDVFELALGMDNSIADNFLPTSFRVDSKNGLIVTSDAAGSNSINIDARWPKLFKGKVDIKTGKLTATLNVENTVPGKVIKRKIVIEGVLLNLEAGDNSFFFQGFSLIPSLIKGEPLTSGSADVVDIVENPQVQANAATAGTYTAFLTSIPTGLPAPDDIPSAGAVSFTISSDLRSVVFDGRTIPLLATDIAHLQFGDVKSAVKVQIIMFLNTTTQQVIGLSANYVSGVGLKGKVATFTSDIVTKQP